MNKIIYDIQIKSVRAALAHLHMIDLEELGQCAQVHGTAEEQAMIAAVIRSLPDLPDSHHY
jgi:hypothetical protein